MLQRSPNSDEKKGTNQVTLKLNLDEKKRGYKPSYLEVQFG